ncbi:MAG: hypothetical protein ACM3NO_01310 [Deltaproteobacteria bacterium]
MRTPEETELIVLRALCQETIGGSLRADAARILPGYVWREPAHQAMFSCLTAIPAVEPEAMRRILLACLTRKGFPDISLEIFFEPQPLTRRQATRLIQSLARTPPFGTDPS